MPLDGQQRVVRAHALDPVVSTLMLFLPPNSVPIASAARPLDRVFDQLLDDGRRPLHHLAGGDLVRKLRRKPMDPVHSQSFL